MIWNERGFTLAEILVAAALIGIGLIALMGVVPMSAIGVQSGNQQSTATFLAQERIEQVRNATWTLVPSVDCVGLSASATAAPTPSGATCNGSTAVTFADQSPSANPIPGFAQYTRTTRITDCGAGAGCGGIVSPAMRLVTVSVTYQGLVTPGTTSAATRSVVLEWLVAQR